MRVFFCFFAFFTYMKEESDESSGENLHDSKTFKGHNQKWRPSHSEYQFAKEHNRDPKWRQWAHPSPTQAAWASESQTQGCREDPCPEPWRPASQGIKERTKGGRRGPHRSAPRTEPQEPTWGREDTAPRQGAENPAYTSLYKVHCNCH